MATLASIFSISFIFLLNILSWRQIRNMGTLSVRIGTYDHLSKSALLRKTYTCFSNISFRNVFSYLSCLQIWPVWIFLLLIQIHASFQRFSVVWCRQIKVSSLGFIIWRTFIQVSFQLSIEILQLGLDG